MTGRRSGAPVEEWDLIGAAPTGAPEPAGPVAATTTGNAAVQRAVAGSGDRRASAVAGLGLAGASNAEVGRALAGAEAAAPFAASVQRTADGGHPPAASLQLTRPTLGERSAESPYQLHLDPEIEAQIRAIEYMRVVLAQERIMAALIDIDLTTVSAPTGPVVAPPVPKGPAAPTAAPPPAGRQSDVRPGRFADVWRAVISDPAVGPVLADLRERATDQARRDWASLSTGEKAALLTVTGAIAGGATAGIMSDPATRTWALERLGGVVLPVPGVPGLGLQVKVGGDVTEFSLHLDLGRLLPAASGFGRDKPRWNRDDVDPVESQQPAP